MTNTNRDGGELLSLELLPNGSIRKKKRKAKKNDIGLCDGLVLNGFTEFSGGVFFFLTLLLDGRVGEEDIRCGLVDGVVSSLCGTCQFSRRPSSCASLLSGAFPPSTLNDDDVCTTLHAYHHKIGFWTQRKLYCLSDLEAA